MNSAPLVLPGGGVRNGIRVGSFRGGRERGQGTIDAGRSPPHRLVRRAPAGGPGRPDLGPGGATHRGRRARHVQRGGGAGRASTPSTDPAAGAILRFDYTIPPGAAAGVWAKRFPEGLKEGGVDLVRPSARAADPGRLRQVAVTLEIKGSAGVQRIPLELHHDWAPAQQDVDWKAIGTLSEVVVSVSRVGEGEPASGTIDLDVRFERLPLSQRLATYRAAKLGGVLLVGLVAALLAALAPRATAGPRPRGGLLRDAVQGAGAVAIAGLAIGIYALELEGTDGGRLAPPRLRGRGRGAGRVVEIRAHRPAPDARRGAPRRPRDRPARGLLQPAGDPPGAEGMVRPARAERDRRGRRGGPLPRRQRREGWPPRGGTWAGSPAP